MSADPLCLCGHPASIHADELDPPRMCFACDCKCHDFWRASRPPQPPPQPGKDAVWPLVIDDARSSGVSSELLHAMRERQEFGLRKYGIQLETCNGRDPLEDALDEALDGVAYMCQWAEEAPDGEERAHRRRLYRLALRWADTLCAERHRKDTQ